MTGQSLYYLGETNLKHKILAIVEEEGAEKASYALKLLQSEGELTIASTGKDPHSGRMETQEYHVEGPVAICLTTTSIDIDEELMNRCLVLTVDELPPQTRRLLESIKTLVREKKKASKISQQETLFTRREVREFTSWTQIQVRRHLDRLQELEYIQQHSGRKGVTVSYTLLVSDEDKPQAYHIGLIDTAKLRKKEAAKEKK